MLGAPTRGGCSGHPRAEGALGRGCAPRAAQEPARSASWRCSSPREPSSRFLPSLPSRRSSGRLPRRSCAQGQAVEQMPPGIAGAAARGARDEVGIQRCLSDLIPNGIFWALFFTSQPFIFFFFCFPILALLPIPSWFVPVSACCRPMGLGCLVGTVEHPLRRGHCACSHPQISVPPPLGQPSPASCPPRNARRGHHEPWGQPRAPYRPFAALVKPRTPTGKGRTPPGIPGVLLGGMRGTPQKVSSLLGTPVPASVANIWRRLFGWEAARRGARRRGAGGGEDLRLVSGAVNPSCNWDFSRPNYPWGSGTRRLPARACGTGNGPGGAWVLFGVSPFAGALR